MRINMKNFINKLNNFCHNEKSKVILNNSKLTTQINCYTNFCSNEIISFAESFNSLFKNDTPSKHIINVHIIDNEDLFNEATNIINNTNTLEETDGVKAFNKATIDTSLAKNTKDRNYYLIKCYEYFIYIFDKSTKSCYMLILPNKKTITMINILLLTPYLMYGELYAVHGGLVNKQNQNILINNNSLGGKTTFAILFASHGWNIITEETTYINQNGDILPFNVRNYFNIRAGTYLAFKDFFIEKGIINSEFLSMDSLTEDALFDYGKKNQFSINFDLLGTKLPFKQMQITHSLKVSINKDQKFNILECSPIENVKSFLNLSLAPTVLLFKELLNYEFINKEDRYQILKNIFSKTKSFTIDSDLNYKDHFNSIIEKLDN